MCLTLKDYRKYTAKTDIICYKHVKVKKLKTRSVLYTSYRNSRVKIGSTYESEFSFNINGEIAKALHSFKNINDCISDARVEINHYINHTTTKSDFFIVKCTIPAGSSYYRGKFCDMPSYASNKLTYVEVVETIEYQHRIII